MQVITEGLVSETFSYALHNLDFFFPEGEWIYEKYVERERFMAVGIGFGAGACVASRDIAFGLFSGYPGAGCIACRCLQKVCWL